MSEANTTNTIDQNNIVIITQTDTNTIKGKFVANSVDIIPYQTHAIFENYHIQNFFGDKLQERMMNLPSDKKDRMYQMLTDYSDILLTILGDVSSPILHYISNPNADMWEPIRQRVEQQNSNTDNYFIASIDYTHPESFINDYNAWKNSKNQS